MIVAPPRLRAQVLLDARRAPSGGVAAPCDVTEIERALESTLGEAASANAGIEIDEGVLLRHLGACLDPELPVVEALGRLRTKDLMLALACVKGDARALARFEAEHVAAGDPALARLGVPPHVVEEAKQIVRSRLVVGDGSPKLLDYDGRGDLRAWVRVSLVREALHLAKRGKKEVGLADDLLQMPASSDDPEVAHFKSRYRAEYKAAFEAAVGKLTDRERALLRQHIVLGMTVDEIGFVYRVHKTTAARWVQAAREELLAKARMELTLRIGASRREIEEIVRLIESGIELSVRRLFAAKGTEG